MLSRLLVIAVTLVLAVCSKSAFQTGGLNPLVKEEGDGNVRSTSSAGDSVKVDGAGKETDQSEGVPGYFVDPESIAVIKTVNGAIEDFTVTGAAGAVRATSDLPSSLKVIIAHLDGEASTEPATFIVQVAAVANVNADGSFQANFSRSTPGIIIMHVSVLAPALGAEITLQVNDDATFETIYVDPLVDPIQAKAASAATAEAIVKKDGETPTTGSQFPGIPQGVYVTSCVSIRNKTCDAYCSDIGKICLFVGTDANGTNSRAVTGADCAGGDFSLNNICSQTQNLAAMTRCRCDDGP